MTSLQRSGSANIETWSTAESPSSAEINAFPRLVVVGPAFNTGSATAITLGNLLQHWPREQLSHVCIERPESSSQVGVDSYYLSLEDIPLDKVVRRALRRGSAQRSIRSALGPVVSCEDRGMRKTLHLVARAWADLLPYRLEPEFWHWIERFNPDVIYSTLASIRTLMLVSAISRHLGKPVVPHFMDDWPTTLHNATLLSAIPRKVMLSRLRSLLKRSSTVMTISDAMAEEYHRRYLLRCEAFMNCVTVPDTCPAPPAGRRKPLRLLYAGGLHLSRWRSLQDIGAAIASLQREGLACELLVYTPPRDIGEYSASLSQWPDIRMAGSATPEKVAEILADADILVHVESFDDSIREYTRFSVSTKIPQYMSAARPILAYGPGEVASLRVVADSGAGVVVGTSSIEEIAQAIRRLSNEEERRRMGEIGWTTARRRHEARSVQERFRQVVVEAATQRPTTGS
jgi:glycosyltransferase involved in cell wall biosynthesis